MAPPVPPVSHQPLFGIVIKLGLESDCSFLTELFCFLLSGSGTNLKTKTVQFSSCFLCSYPQLLDTIPAVETHSNSTMSRYGSRGVPIVMFGLNPSSNV